jgi:hypothetical protein
MSANRERREMMNQTQEGGSAKELIKLVVGSYPDPDHDLSTTLSDGSVLFVNSD